MHNTAIPSATGSAHPDETERRRIAAQIVAAMRADLDTAAEGGHLTNEFGTGITTGYLGGAAALPEAATLICCHRNLAEATDEDPGCANPWAVPGEGSCFEAAVQRLAATEADRLIDQLVDGPWPI